MPDLDLDALTGVAEAATSGEWRIGSDPLGQIAVRAEKRDALAVVTWDDDRTHIATFDPPTVLALIAEAREAERLRREVAALVDVGERDGRGNSLDLARRLRALIGGER